MSFSRHVPTPRHPLTHLPTAPRRRRESGGGSAAAAAAIAATAALHHSKPPPTAGHSSSSSGSGPGARGPAPNASSSPPVGSSAGRSSGGPNSSSSGGAGGGQGGAAAAGGGGSKGPVNANYLLNFQYDSRTVRVSCGGWVGEWVCGPASSVWCCKRLPCHVKQVGNTRLHYPCWMPAKSTTSSSYHPGSPPLPIHRPRPPLRLCPTGWRPWRAPPCGR